MFGAQVMTAMASRGVGCSDVGRKRKQNEDSFVVDEGLGLYVVSDGMGGHAAGDVASQAAVAFVADTLKSERDLIDAVREGKSSPATLAAPCKKTGEQANRHVHGLARTGKGRPGMGATLTMLVVAGDVAVMAHVGDSRLYLVRGEVVSQLSQDHTITAEMRRAGLISEDEVETSPFAHVLSRAVGTKPEVEFDVLTLEVVPGDRFLICSDGYSNYLEHPDDLASRLADAAPEELTRTLVDEANAAGGKDNITVVVVTVEGDDTDALRTKLLEERYGALRSVFLFSDLDLPLLTRVMTVCDVESHEAGEMVVTEGEPFEELIIIVDGRFALLRGDEVVGHVGAGDHVGATALVQGRPARAGLITEEAGHVLRLRREAFRRLTRERPWLGLGLLREMGRMLSEALDRSWAQRAGAAVPVPDGERL